MRLSWKSIALGFVITIANVIFAGALLVFLPLYLTIPDRPTEALVLGLVGVYLFAFWMFAAVFQYNYFVMRGFMKRFQEKFPGKLRHKKIFFSGATLESTFQGERLEIYFYRGLGYEEIALNFYRPLPVADFEIHFDANKKLKIYYSISKDYWDIGDSKLITEEEFGFERQNDEASRIVDFLTIPRRNLIRETTTRGFSRVRVERDRINLETKYYPGMQKIMAKNFAIDSTKAFQPASVEEVLASLLQFSK